MGQEGDRDMNHLVKEDSTENYKDVDSGGVDDLDGDKKQWSTEEIERLQNLLCTVYGVTTELELLANN